MNIQNHDHNHNHDKKTHTHSPEEIKMVSNRLAKAIGHLEAVKGMVESGRDCSEILVQLSAVRSAITNTGKLVFKNHLEHCIVEAVKNESYEEIDKIVNAMNSFVK